MNDSSQEANGFERTPEDDLFWTAAQYVAGDLPAGAAEEFEGRLEVDQSAREALAQAVALSQAVVQIEGMPRHDLPPVVAASAATHRSQSFAWFAIAASLLLAVVAYRSQSGGEKHVNEQTALLKIAVPTLAEQRLALAWAENQVDGSSDDLFGEPIPGDLLPADSLYQDEGFDVELPSVATDPSAPDWLLAAVADAAATPAAGGN